MPRLRKSRSVTLRGQRALVGIASVQKIGTDSAPPEKGSCFTEPVLNAKYHKREAEIVAQADQKGAVTIATRTDILLGGNPDFMVGEFLKGGCDQFRDRSEPKKNGQRLSAVPSE